MAENKMEQVAALFGKKLGEEFIVKTRYKGDLKCKFTNRGLYYFDECVHFWGNTSSYILEDLLTGRVVIVDA